MSVRKIRSSWWVDFRFSSVRHRKRSPDNSRQGALVYEATLRQRLAKGEPVDGPARAGPTCSPPFDEFAKEWLATYVEPSTKPNTAKGWRNTVRGWFIPWFGSRPLDQITTEQIEQFKAREVKRGIAASTINRQLVVLRRLLQVAVEWGHLTAVPRVRKLREPTPTFTFLTADECARLLSDQTDRVCHEMALLALRTGLRYGELAALRWEDVNLDRQVLTVRQALSDKVFTTPKNNKERTIPLAEDVGCVLTERAVRTGLVFARAAGGHIRPECALGALHRLCQRTGVRKIGWHALRHTFASHLVMQGVSLRTVQELLGHADLRMTLRYSHLTPATLHDAVDLLARVLPANLGQPVGNAAPLPEMTPIPGNAESPVLTGDLTGWPQAATL